MKPTRVKNLVAKSASGHFRERDCFGKHLKGTRSSLPGLKTVSQMQNFIFKKMKFPTKRRDPSKEALQPTQMLVWFFHFTSQLLQCQCFCQEDLRTNESFSKTNSNKHPRSRTILDQDFFYQTSSCSAEVLLFPTIPFKKRLILCHQEHVSSAPMQESICQCQLVKSLR